MQHHILDRLGVGLLVRGCQHFLGLPTARRGDVLHGTAFPLRRPLPPNRVPHPATLRHDLCQPIRPLRTSVNILRMRMDATTDTASISLLERAFEPDKVNDHTETSNRVGTPTLLVVPMFPSWY